MRIATALIAATMLATTAACSGAGGSPEPGSSSYVPTISDDALLALGKEVVQCMRDNGVADMPDPFVEDHRLKVPDDEMDAAESKAGEQGWSSARQACQDTFDKIPQGAIANDEGDQGEPKPPGPEDVEALRKMAQCYRENGVPEWPDPDSEGRFPLKGTALENEKPEPGNRLDKAREACQQFWSGPIGIS